MACTARTYQRLMEKALSEQWWPLMHNAEGTFGSIDLGYKYDELMNSLRCSSQNSCLEKGLDHIGKDNLKEILENQSVNEAWTLRKIQTILFNKKSCFGKVSRMDIVYIVSSDIIGMYYNVCSYVLIYNHIYIYTYIMYIHLLLDIHHQILE